VDGPREESLSYYKEKYNVPDNWIWETPVRSDLGGLVRRQATIAATRENLDIMLNDKEHAYGHGYCLADALLEDLATEDLL